MFVPDVLHQSWALTQFVQFSRGSLGYFVVRVAVRVKKFCCSLNSSGELTSQVHFTFPACAKKADDFIFSSKDAAWEEIKLIYAIVIQ